MSSQHDTFTKHSYPNDETPMPGVWDSRPLGFSQAITISGPSRRIYLAGQASMNEQGEVLFPDDKLKQLEVCFANVERILNALGATSDDMVSVNILVVNYDPARDLEVWGPYWKKYLKNATSTFYGVQSLALPGLLVEVTVIAEVPQDR